MRNLDGRVAAITGAGRGIGRGMRVPNTAHTSRPWRIHDIAPDFELEDVWALPTPGGPDDFPGWCARCPRADRPSPARPARCGSSGGRPTYESLRRGDLRALHCTDMPSWSPLFPLLGVAGPIDVQRAHSIINAYSLAFFDRHLKSRSATRVDVPTRQCPEVLFETRRP